MTKVYVRPSELQEAMKIVPSGVDIWVIPDNAPSSGYSIMAESFQRRAAQSATIAANRERMASVHAVHVLQGIIIECCGDCPTEEQAAEYLKAIYKGQP